MFSEIVIGVLACGLCLQGLLIFGAIGYQTRLRHDAESEIAFLHQRISRLEQRLRGGFCPRPGNMQAKIIHPIDGPDFERLEWPSRN